MRIDINMDDSGKPNITVDGEPIGDRELRDRRELGMSHGLVWLNGERQYDIEVFKDGELHVSVPPQSAEVDAEYDRADSGPIRPQR